MEINDVSDTAYWVAYYRALENDRTPHFFDDPFARALAGERGRSMAESMGVIGRYAQWSVVSRTVIIDRYIQKLIEGGVDAVVSLGAGLDARPYRMELPASLEWVEADYPRILQYKSEVMRLVKPRCRLTQAGLDLSDAKARRKFLAGVVRDAKCVLILTEGVIPYLTEEQVAELSADLRAEERFKFWVVEYFDPRVYKYVRGSRDVRALKKAPFQFFPDPYLAFFENLGWKENETRFTGEIAVEFNRLPPMPWFFKLLLPLIPKAKKDEAMKMTGYTVWKR